MAALLYNLDHKAGGNPKAGSFWMFARVDFSEYPTLATGDSIRIGKVKDGWIIMNSYWRMPTASTSTGTADIGFGAAGQVDIVTAADLDGGNTDWTVGTITGGTELNITASNEHLVITVDAAVATDGILEVMYEVVAYPSDTEPADANIDD